MPKASKTPPKPSAKTKADKPAESVDTALKSAQAGPPVVSEGPASPTPTAFSVRAYTVGFGDCFLLTFTYLSQKKHILVDFGSVRLPKDAPSDQLAQIARDIKTLCGSDGLLAVVVSHRHRDHISGFSTDHANDPGKTIADLKPKYVLQPWTENPDAQADAPTAPEHQAFRFVSMLGSMQGFAEHALLESRLVGLDGRKNVELGLTAENNLPNQSAVDNLRTMGTKANHEYLAYGRETSLVQDLPGVKLWVLGPPTREQSQAITHETSSDPSEFWQLQHRSALARATGGGGGELRSPFANKPSWQERDEEPYPENVRWFMEKANAVRAEEMLGLVRSLDGVMNNTSLILLFEIGGKRFLFPGDAQLENWSYALSQPEVLKLLEDIELYKVGHHGSRNATPKTMWNAVKGHAAEDLATVVSTMPGVYGDAAKKTEVPRTTLVEELTGHSHFHTTEDQKELFQDIRFELDGGAMRAVKEVA
jgi:hypothetical protein